MNINEIFARYAEEMKTVDQQLLGIFSSNTFLIPMIGQHLISGGGKRIRPLFLLLTADLCGYEESNRALLAAIIEAIHTASLLHDDIIDGADTRRGKPAAHAVWGNQVVILVGDFLYSKALKIAVDQKNQKIMEALSEATTRMTEGEILQLNKVGDPEITKEEYFEIVAAKTGVLISAACRIGGILANQSEENEMALARFGMKTGIAFQLADDILDYIADQRTLGKKLGKDLEEGKITMPLIYLLKNASAIEQDEIRGIVKTRAENEEGLQRIMELFEKYHTIEESLKIAEALVEEATSELACFPYSKGKEALLAMAEYTMQRKE
jgi:octaprenyl-diphosphate synthase